MHPALFEAYALELPRLEAAEQLAAIATTAAGTGRLKPEAHREIIGALRRAAGAARAARARRLRTPDELAAIGVGLVRS
jgi:Ni,Fe-hydrogenase III large subunit